MKTPTAEHMEHAAAWLREYDGANADECHQVADWLDHQALQGKLRDAAREGGVPVAALRKRLRRMEKA